MSPRLRTSLLLAAALLVCAAQVGAQVPNLVHFQARLTTSTGTPLAGLQTYTVRIYTVPVAGVPVWFETHATIAVNGVVSVLLGSSTPLPAGLFDGSKHKQSFENLGHLVQLRLQPVQEHDRGTFDRGGLGHPAFQLAQNGAHSSHWIDSLSVSMRR